jgi:LysM repeat protein
MTRTLGKKTDELSLNSMNVNFLLTALMLSLPAKAGQPQQPHSTLVIQDLKATLGELSYQFQAQKTDLELLQEQFSKLEAKFERLEKTAYRPQPKDETVYEDLKLLKSHLEKTQAALAQCEKKVAILDKQLEKDISVLKENLKSMLGYLQPQEDTLFYVVKPGDSLGQIAQMHKLSTKRLKELNQLASDTIRPGQKLQVSER